MKKTFKKLVLSKHTVRSMTEGQMSGAAGGKMTGVSKVFCVTDLCSVACSKAIDTDCNPNETWVGCPIPDSIGC